MVKKNSYAHNSSKKLSVHIYSYKLTPEKLIIFLSLFLCLLLIVNSICRHISRNDKEPITPFDEHINFPGPFSSDNRTNKNPFFDFSIQIPEEAIMNYNNTMTREDMHRYIFPLMPKNFHNAYKNHFEDWGRMIYNHRNLLEFLGYYRTINLIYFNIILKEHQKQIEDTFIKKENGSNMVFEFLVSSEYFKKLIKGEMVLDKFLKHNFGYLGWNFNLNSRIYRRLSRIANFILFNYREVLDTLEKYIQAVARNEQLIDPVAVFYLFKFKHGIVDKQCLNLVLFIFEVVKEEGDIERLELREYFKLHFKEVEKIEQSIKEICTSLKQIDEMIHLRQGIVGEIGLRRPSEIPANDDFLCWLVELDREYQRFSSGVKGVIEKLVFFSGKK